MERVAIIGAGGAGKSTLARQLGEVTGLPVIHLDREHWQPRWVEPPRDEWAARVAALAAGERWIIDGNYGGTMAPRFAPADTIVFLDFPRWLCIYRAMKRSLIYRNRTRPDMTPGCEERFDLQFMKWIWQYRATRRPGILKRLRELKPEGKRIVVLKSPRQADRFLERIRREADGIEDTGCRTSVFCD